MMQTSVDLARIEDYHADTTHVTSSMLKSLNRSPRVFEGEYISRTIVREPSPAMAFGTALHTAVLEPDRFETEYAVCPPKCSDKRTKAHKEWAAENEGKAVLTLAEYWRIRGCVDAIRQHPIGGPAIAASGPVERTVTWTDSTTGVACKCRPDKVAGSMIVDVKTTKECDGDAFGKTCADFGYHIQAAHYLRGIPAATGFLFIVVETSQPFRCRCFSLDFDALDCGDFLVGKLLDEYRRRSESGDWSEPNEDKLVPVSLPDWYMRKVW